ncbi:hypothetical protein CC86DRAFT_78865 [Ophiobolus disseminans]|uniref:Uncharacterized protein n=1 Tax=Ophiobolus disseminans TaxID=1469910 RepID=A0A6A6ZNL8_9PLEO|nr:hypothetical protein CC86DRAFT_78865 [Ophiobolus disseminans]
MCPSLAVVRPKTMSLSISNSSWAEQRLARVLGRRARITRIVLPWNGSHNVRDPYPGYLETRGKCLLVWTAITSHVIWLQRYSRRSAMHGHSLRAEYYINRRIAAPSISTSQPDPISVVDEHTA